MKQPKFSVGDKAYWKSMDEIVDIREVHIAYTIARPTSCEYGRIRVPMIHESRLEPAPEPLPEDHLERHMVEGAIIQREGPWLVLPNRRLKYFHGGNVLQVDEGGVNFLETGWSFHPDSPIQTPREPT